MHYFDWENHRVNLLYVPVITCPLWYSVYRSRKNGFLLSLAVWNYLKPKLLYPRRNRSFATVPSTAGGSTRSKTLTYADGSTFSDALRQRGAREVSLFVGRHCPRWL